MVIALAGRRIDAVDAPAPAFPLENAGTVRIRLRDFFQTHHTKALVCSAACGTDLVALEIAGALGIRRRIILPFAPERFRVTSVTDRPGEWGGLYDRVIADAQARSDLLVLSSDWDDDAAYAAVNTVILDEAADVGKTLNDSPMAALVWEGTPRDGADLTQAFGIEAKKRRMPVVEIRTM